MPSTRGGLASTRRPATSVAHPADPLAVGPVERAARPAARRKRDRVATSESLVRWPPDAGAERSPAAHVRAGVACEPGESGSPHSASAPIACQHPRHQPTRRSPRASDDPHPSPPVLSGGAGVQPEVHRQGPHAARRPGLPRPRGRVRAAGQAGRPQDHRRGAERGRLGRARSASSASTTGPPSGPTATSSRSSRARAPTSTRSCCRRCRPPSRCVALDLLLTQIEKTMGYEVGRIGIEAQIENALGLTNVNAIATASPAHRDDHLRPGRLHGLDQHEVAGGRRAAARLRRRRRLPPHPHVDPHGRPRPRPAGHRRPVPADQDVDGFRRVAGRSAALGFDGKWVLHPGQIDAANEVVHARRRTTTTTPRTSSTPTSAAPRRRAARRARRCSATR